MAKDTWTVESVLEESKKESPRVDVYGVIAYVQGVNHLRVFSDSVTEEARAALEEAVIGAMDALTVTQLQQVRGHLPDGYDSMDVESILRLVPKLNVRTLELVRTFELGNKNRVEILKCIDSSVKLL